jgi:hypothetical protein
MRNQVVYETNAHYELTKENLAKQPNITVDITQKGLLWFRILGLTQFSCLALKDVCRLSGKACRKSARV